MKEYVAFWKNFANFSARTTIRGYWMAFLFNFLAGLVLGAIVALLPDLAFISGIYSLAVLVPNLAIIVRRLNDAGKHWGWIFISLVPAVGWIILIIMLCKPAIPDNGVAVV